MKRFMAALAPAALVGCATVDDLRARPIAWTAVYPVRFDTMANCLAVRMVDEATTVTLTVTPQFYQAEKRAVLTGGVPNRWSIEYSVRQISETDSEVNFRRMETAFNNEFLLAKSRALADRCGRGA